MPDERSAGEQRGASPALALEFMAVGAGLTLVFTLAAALPSWRSDLGRLQALMLVAFAFFGLALARRDRWRGLPWAGVAVVVVALAMRAAVWPVVPALSDDLYRYVWDGRVLAHGLDPYAHAPADSALAGLADALLPAHVNHPELRTIYPPLAEAGFAIAALAWPGLAGMKAWIVLHDLALVALLAWWCSRRCGSALPAIAYAWNPLVVLEYAGSGHHDPTGLFWLVLALAVLEERPLLSAAAFSAAVLVKLAPLVALPFLFVRWPARARLLAVALTGGGLALFVILASGPGSGLEAYAAHWRNNEFAFHYLALLLGEPRARGAALALVVLVAGALLWRRADAARGARATLATLLLTGPVLHPWYLGWVLVFEPLAPAWPLLLLSALALLNYGVFASPPEGGAFHLGLSWRWLEYGVPLAAAVLAMTIEWHGGRKDGRDV